MNFNKNPAKFGKQQLTAIAAILIVGTGAAAYILNGGKSKPEGDGHGHEQHSEAKEHADGEHHGAKAADAHDHDKGHADDEHHEKAPGKGPHGGSLFADGDASVEVALSEVGGEPHFQVWGFNKNQPVAANQMKIIATLTCADGERMDVSLGTVGAELKSWQAIEEPHVFDAAFVATMGQQTVRFTFSREEGKIELERCSDCSGRHQHRHQRSSAHQVFHAIAWRDPVQRRSHGPCGAPLLAWWKAWRPIWVNL